MKFNVHPIVFNILATLELDFSYSNRHVVYSNAAVCIHNVRLTNVVIASACC